MKVVRLPEPGAVEIAKLEKPVPAKGEALLKIKFGGLCGSDLGSYRGTFLYANYPLIPGHEFSAEIVEIGENDKGLKPGMLVTANPYMNCGKCYSCKRGFVNCCEHNETLGAQRDGAFREYFTMPIERLHYGKSLNAQQLALIEPFCISYHAVKRANVKEGDRVLVVGAGTIGHFAAKAAKLKGAEVYIADVSKMKLDLASPIGLAGTILNTNEDEFKAEVDRVTEGNGFDVCIEAVGLPSTFQNCIDAAAFRGRIAVVGVGKKSLDFFYTIIQKKELDIFGSRNALNEDFSELIDAVDSNAVSLDGVVSAVFNYEDAADAFETFSTKGGELLKVMLEF